MTLRWHQLDSAGPTYRVCGKTSKWSFAWSSSLFCAPARCRALSCVQGHWAQRALPLLWSSGVRFVCGWDHRWSVGGPARLCEMGAWDSGQWCGEVRLAGVGMESLQTLLEGFLVVAHEANTYLLSFCYIWGAVLSLVGTYILMSKKLLPKPMDLRLGPQCNNIQRWSLERWLIVSGLLALAD